MPYPEPCIRTRHFHAVVALVGLLTLGLAGCSDSDTPTAPTSGISTTAPPATTGGTPGGPGIPSPTRTMSVAIDGVPFAPTTVTAVRSVPGPEIVTLAAVSLVGGATTSLGITALAQVGVHTIAPQQFTQSTLTVISGNSSSGFLAFQTSGRGTVTITSISATGVVGSVDLVLVPTSGATTNRAITGTFDVAF
jgi:hypothetical protein